MGNSSNKYSDRCCLKKENVPEKYKLSESEKRELCKSGNVEIWTVQDSGKFSFMRPGITRRAEKEGEREGGE